MTYVTWGYFENIRLFIPFKVKFMKFIDSLGKFYFILSNINFFIEMFYFTCICQLF